MHRLVLAMFLFLYTIVNGIVQTKSHGFKGPPEDVILTWESDQMIIQSRKPQYTKYDKSEYCLTIVLQLRSSNVIEWQRTITSSTCSQNGSLSVRCSFTNLNLDQEKCLEMQFKFKIKDACIETTPASEWCGTIFLKNGSILDSCADVVGTMLGEQHSFPKRNSFIILFSTISSLVFFAISLLCVMERLKTCVFPIIPDPKNIFSELFDSHSGYIQEWIKTSGNETQQEDIEWVMEEHYEEQISIYMKEDEVVASESQHDIGEQVENVTTSVSFLENASDVCFGNMNFTMNESMYIML